MCVGGRGRPIVDHQHRMTHIDRSNLCASFVLTWSVVKNHDERSAILLADIQVTTDFKSVLNGNPPTARTLRYSPDQATKQFLSPV